MTWKHSYESSDYQIVLYRMLSNKPVTVGFGSPQFDASIKVSRIVEDLLASGTLYNAPSIMYDLL